MPSILSPENPKQQALHPKQGGVVGCTFVRWLGISRSFSGPNDTLSGRCRIQASGFRASGLGSRVE